MAASGHQAGVPAPSQLHISNPWSYTTMSIGSPDGMHVHIDALLAT